MASNMIPRNVDCIIIGTGLTNSILAAACSRIGKSVLHVDRNNYYGNEWASFTFQQLLDWIKLNKPEDECLKSTPEELLTKSRMFCIDLCPKLLYSNGALVDLLVKSNVSRYHEFKNNIRILSMIENEIHIMPCRRSDVFTSPLLTDLIDKRRLMKFIELCIKFELDQETPESQEITLNADKPISQFLDEKGLKFTLKEYIINSIAMVRPTDSTKKACENIKRFMVATERFGRSPFIFPLYGCGEFPQSFCRLSAVFGGIYCLNTQIDEVNVDRLLEETIKSNVDSQEVSSCKEKFKIKFSNNEYEVASEMLVMDHSSAIELEQKSTSSDYDKISRAIIITSKSVVQNSENLLSFLRIPPSQTNANIVYLLELNSSVMVCPQNMNILYFWTKSSSSANARDDIRSTVNRVLGEETSAIIWEFYFHQLTSSDEANSSKTSEMDGLFITNPPCDDIDYDNNIKEAELIFKKMFPDQEFLPRAPDPDEIVT